jgi:Exopolyphosphatase
METSLKPSRGKVAAFLDMGTNSVRLLVVRVDPGGVYTVLNQQREVVRLGEGEFQEQLLQPEAMDRAVLVCRKFNDLARAYGAEDIVAVATSATRDAENQGKFLARLEKEAGLEVRVISGREEARLIYLGVSSGVHMGSRNAAFIDIGGGSTEVIVGNQAEHAYLDTLKLGAIRLTQMFFLPDEKGPVSAPRYALICQYVKNAAIRTSQRVREHKIDMALGSSGTIMNLAEIAHEMKLKGGHGGKVPGPGSPEKSRRNPLCPSPGGEKASPGHQPGACGHPGRRSGRHRNADGPVGVEGDPGERPGAQGRAPRGLSFPPRKFPPAFRNDRPPEERPAARENLRPGRGTRQNDEPTDPGAFRLGP